MSVEDYVQFLKTLYGFHLPIERTLRGFERALVDVLPDIDRRISKSVLLKSDVQTLSGGDSPPLPIDDTWPAIDTMSRALGTLYVIEGSTLGGQVIQRHLARVLPELEQRGANRFLSGGYGADSGAMWKTFRSCTLGAVERDLANNDEIVRAACDTFRRVEDWFRRNNEPIAAAAQ